MKKIIFLIGIIIVLLNIVYANENIVGIYKDGNKTINLTPNKEIKILNEEVTITIGERDRDVYHCKNSVFSAVWDDFEFTEIYYSNYTRYFMSIAIDKKLNREIELSKNITQDYYDYAKSFNFSQRTNFYLLANDEYPIIISNATPPKIIYEQEKINKFYLQNIEGFLSFGCYIWNEDYSYFNIFDYNFGRVTYHEKQIGGTYYY